MGLEEITSVLKKFLIPSKDYSAEAITHGHINRSFAVIDKESNRKKYFLQQVDHSIFPDIEGIMSNIKLVEKHFEGLSHPPPVLSTIKTGTNSNFYRSKIGEYWRLFNYVEGNTYDKASDRAMATEAGKMFGEFLNALNSLDPEQLETTLPRFHDINLRYDQFTDSLVNADLKRKEKSAHLISQVEENIDRVKEIYHTIVRSCPLRATHNDTKLSNLLFDEDNKGICVVDYDTFMPGWLPLDFGDTIRTLCSTTDEDDPDIAKTDFDMIIFNAFGTAFINQLAQTITVPELNNLSKAVPYMPFLMGLRMLTDYFNNDIYYTTRSEHHNFERASNQFKLYQSGVEKLDEMTEIIENTYKTTRYHE